MLKSLIKFNFKIIFKDKISIFWSIILPLVFLLINSHKKIDINEALIYCAYYSSNLLYLWGGIKGPKTKRKWYV